MRCAGIHMAMATAACCLWPGLATGQFAGRLLDSRPSYANAVWNGVVGGRIVDTAVEPTLWPVAGGSPISLGTAGYVMAMNSVGQYGHLGVGAAMWVGSASNYVNLHPSGFLSSDILAASSNQQGGWVWDPVTDFPNAALWSGSAGSVVYLAPPNTRTSYVHSITETRQGGYVIATGPNAISRATLWSGSAASLVDLHPQGYPGSAVYGMFGDQQVGSAGQQAAMWSGTAASFRSMHPFSGGQSFMNATCGSAQVGYVNAAGFGSGIRASIWFGTAESVFDLSQFLPPGTSQSIATAVEERNGVFTIAGYAFYGNNEYAVVWTGVPSPGAACVMMCAGVWAGRRRRVG